MDADISLAVLCEKARRSARIRLSLSAHNILRWLKRFLPKSWLK